MFYYEKLMLDIKDYLTQMAVGMTDDKSLYEAKWGKVKKLKRIKTAVKDYKFLDYKLTEDDLP
jgi:hypothetical protein